MATHELKTNRESFGLIWLGMKKFEWRKNDRDFRQSDELKLREYDAEQDEGEQYSGREITCVVGQITLGGGLYSIPPGYCIMSITVTERSGTE